MMIDCLYTPSLQRLQKWDNCSDQRTDLTHLDHWKENNKHPKN